VGRDIDTFPVKIYESNFRGQWEAVEIGKIAEADAIPTASRPLRTGFADSREMPQVSLMRKLPFLSLTSSARLKSSEIRTAKRAIRCFINSSIIWLKFVHKMGDNQANAASQSPLNPTSFNLPER
jgi:hypothetical protein